MRMPIRRFLEEAGLSQGMKVLDIGCGAGDVSVLAAEIVGPSGSIVGIDLNGAILDTARARVSEGELTNVTFQQARIPDGLKDVAADFDALVGRRVLCYIPSPHEALQALLAHMPSGGIVAFSEVDWTVWSQNSFPLSPAFDEVWGWIYKAFEAGGNEMAMGTKLYQVFVDSGLPEPTMRAEAGIGPASALNFPLTLLRSVRETILREGIASAEDTEPEAVRARLTKELTATKSVITGGFEVRAWATKP
jgi:ubiquinone/menaquinone biosynthesis C-methylase UbiE